MEALRLPTGVGTQSADGYRISTGEPGALSFGPYISLTSGKYVAGYYIRRIGAPVVQNIVLDVFIKDTGVWVNKTITHQSLFDDIATFVYMSFELPDPASDVEFRVHVDKGVQIELRDLVVLRADQRTWSAA